MYFYFYVNEPYEVTRQTINVILTFSEAYKLVNNITLIDHRFLEDDHIDYILSKNGFIKELF